VVARRGRLPWLGPAALLLFLLLLLGLLNRLPDGPPQEEPFDFLACELPKDAVSVVGIAGFGVEQPLDCGPPFGRRAVI